MGIRVIIEGDGSKFSSGTSFGCNVTVNLDAIVVVQHKADCLQLFRLKVQIVCLGLLFDNKLRSGEQRIIADSKNQTNIEFGQIDIVDNCIMHLQCRYGKKHNIYPQNGRISPMISKSICGLAILLLVVCSTGASTLMASGGSEATSAMSGMAGTTAGMMEELNINTASIDSLSQIPGLSPKIGEAIAAYRDANGAFKSVSDLINVEEIDAGLLEKIKPFLTI